MADFSYIAGTRANGDGVVVCVPFYTEVETIAGSWTVPGLEAEHPQFSGNFTVFVHDDEIYQKALACGFRDIIIYKPYCTINDVWTFENGSHIDFSVETLPSQQGTYDVYHIDYYDANDVLVFTLSQQESNKNYANTLPSATEISGNYYSAHFYFNTPTTFQFFPDNKFPRTSYYGQTNFWEGLAGGSDPLSPGGTSGAGGGQGSFSGTGDAIAIPSLPTLGAVSTGFITIFNPTLSQLASLASYMWDSSLFDLSTWQKLWADPMDAILGLSIVPVQVPNGGTASVKVGNISTGVAMTKAAAQYVEVDCGTLSVKEYWGAYLDYDPYTKAEIYLPYIGTHALSVDDIMGKAVHVVYHVDILSGACCAYVKCGSSVLYTFIGQCSSSIPISGTDFTNVINGVLSAGVSIGSMVATGGATAPMAVPSLASTAVNGLKPTVEKSGAMAGTGGMMGIQTPYLILTRPRQALPEKQNSFTGYPSFITRKLGDLTGYTEIETIHLENVPATESELSEIESLLKGGVIF